jgi:hypothetical protein
VAAEGDEIGIVEGGDGFCRSWGEAASGDQSP